MDDIISFLDSFNIEQVTEQYCSDLRSKNSGKLTQTERKKLEHIIREFRDTDYNVVLGAIVIYTIFYPDEAMQYARQKRVFYYGSRWKYTVCCIESLNDLSNLLQIPQHQQRYLQQKIACKWLKDFYEKIEDKLKRDICKHYRERIKYKSNNVIYESNLITELLAYISLFFRRHQNFISQFSDVKELDKKYNCVDDYTNEEICEAISYLIYIFTEIKGVQPKKQKWMDCNYIQSKKIEKLILLACHRNIIAEWEFMVDCFGYEIEADEKSIKIYDASSQTEKSLRIGFIKTSIQEQAITIKNTNISSISLQEVAQITVENLGDSLFEYRCEHKWLERYQMIFPLQLLQPLIPTKNNGELELFREEYLELCFAYHELTFMNASIFQQMVTKHCSVVDFILFKRIFIFFHFCQNWLFDNKKDVRKILHSIVPVMQEEELVYIIKNFVGSREKAIEILNFLSWDGEGKLDLQYTPIIKIDNNRYYIAIDILISSNIARNSIVLARSKNISASNSDGQNDPLELFCQESFNKCSFPYQTRSNVSYRYNGKQGEIDFLAWSDNRIYIIECKKAILPASSHEIRATYEHIQKASCQLDMSMTALQDKTFQKTYFPQWGISFKERTVHTCILFGNRLFAVPNGMRHPVRYAYELNMVLTSGTISSDLGHWSCWASEEYTDEDLARYLSDNDSLSMSFLEAMQPYTETHFCLGKKLQMNSYAYNYSLHLKTSDKYLRIIDKNNEEIQRLFE